MANSTSGDNRGQKLIGYLKEHTHELLTLLLTAGSVGWVLSLINDVVDVFKSSPAAAASICTIFFAFGILVAYVFGFRDACKERYEHKRTQDEMKVKAAAAMKRDDEKKAMAFMQLSYTDKVRICAVYDKDGKSTVSYGGPRYAMTAEDRYLFREDIGGGSCSWHVKQEYIDLFNRHPELLSRIRDAKYYTTTLIDIFG